MSIARVLIALAFIAFVAAGVAHAAGTSLGGTVTQKVKLVAGPLRYRCDARAPVLPGGRVSVS
jgi:hypothetical protein